MQITAPSRPAGPTVGSPGGPRIGSPCEEPRRPPLLSLVLGFGAMVPFLLGAAGVLLLPPGEAGPVAHLTVLWGGALLTFFAGVRRGLSFRTLGGPTVAQIVTMFWFFGLGFAVLVLPDMRAAPALLILGYLSLAVLDPLAARRGEVPPYFAPMRPLQALFPVLSFAVLLVMG